ncbi:MAG: sulfatase-like hydrolase/transferase [Treponema sp.]|nr:sulfatase-like hydrolase/transferase [Treponema sp.]
MKKPNFLLLFSDQHNYSYMGCAGHPFVQTPSLDKLAAEGVRFPNAYCQNPLCVPSRANLMTGNYCRNNGIYDNRHCLQSNGVTLPKILGTAGYRTCVIGKTHFNGEQWQGFQQRPYGDLYGQGHQQDPFRDPQHKGKISGNRDIVADSGPSGIPLPMTQTELCVAEASKWLQVHAGKEPEIPFFLSVNFEKPHFPINPPKNYFDHYKDKVSIQKDLEDYLEKSAVPFVKNAARNNGVINHRYHHDLILKTLAAYCGCVEWVDNAVGRIVDVLDYLGLKDDTVVIYTTDHGEMAYERGFWQKTVFFDSSARIPFIFRCPSRFSPGRTQADLAGIIDLLPTMCDLAGIKLEPEYDGVSINADGVSLADALVGGRPLDRRDLFCESTVLKEPEHSGCMLRTGKWKYNHYLDNGDELYDMEADTRELNNLVNDPAHASISKDLRSRVISFWEPEKQLDRYNKTPMMSNEKHFNFYANQFMLGDGFVVDARP